MASRAATNRLQKEYKDLQNDSPPYIAAHPAEASLLEWHYLIDGPEDTPYHGGQYHGVLIFPPDYPYGPPTIKMFTPSGRFSPNTRLCLTISDYHRETWNPSWSVATILIGLLSYMLEDDVATGGIKTSDAEKQQLAIASKDWNSKQDSFRHNWSVKYFLKPPEKTKAEIPPCDEWNIFNQSDTDDNIVDADDEDAIEG